MSSGIKNFFNLQSTSTLRVDERKFHTMIEEVLNKIYINQNEGTLIDKKYSFVSTIRFTQRRIKIIDEQKSNSPILFYSIDEQKNQKTIKRLATTKISYNSEYKDKNEDSETYNGFIFDKEKSYQEYGGYVFEYDPMDIPLISNNHYETYQNFIDDPNGQMTSIVVDFAIINPSLKYIINIVFIYESNKSSLGDLNVNFFFLNKNFYNSTVGIFSAVFESLYVIALVIYIIFSLYENYSIAIYYKNPNRNASNCEAFVSHIFSDISFLLQIISFLLSISFIAIWITVIIMKKGSMDAIREAFLYNKFLTYEERNKIIKISEIIKIYKIVHGVNVLFLLCRLVKIISRYMDTMKMFLNAVRTGIAMIIAFFIYFIAIILGFTFFSWMYYGRSFVEYSTIAKAFNENFTLSLGLTNKNIFELMYTFNSPISFLYFLSMSVIVKFVIVNVLIAILIYYYRNAYVNYELKAKMNAKQIEEKNIKRSLIYQVMLFYIKVIEWICCKKGKGFVKMINKKENVIKCDISKRMINDELKLKKEFDRKNKESKKGRKEEIIDVINANFNEDYEFNARNLYFDSEKDKNKISKYFNEKYRIIFTNSIVYILFLICFIIVTFYSTLSSWNYTYSSFIQNRILYAMLVDSPITNFDIKTAISFSINKFPSLFINDKIHFYNNTLLYNDILFTFNTNQTASSSYHKDFIYYISQSDEDHIALYDKYQSYNNKGGYCLINTLSDDKRLTTLNLPITANEFTNEFILLNKEEELGIYGSVTISLDEGGDSSIDINVDIIKSNHSQGKFDNVKYTFIVFAFIFLFVIAYIVVRDNIAKWKKYSKWYYDVISPQSEKAKKLRDDIEIEILRQVKEIVFTLENIFDIAVIIIFIVTFSYSMNVIYNESNFTETKSIYELRDIAYKIKSSRNKTTVLSCIIILLTSLRIVFEILKFSKYFKTIYLTLSIRARHLISVLCLIIIIHPCFILYTYISIGEVDVYYSTFSRSMLSILKALFGYIDLDELINFNTFIGVLLYYSYLIVVNMIILNFFFCVIYSCYVFVKKSQMSQHEMWTWSGILCFDRFAIKENEDIDDRTKNENQINSQFEYKKNVLVLEAINKSKLSLNLNFDEWLISEKGKIKELDALLYEMFFKKKMADIAYNTAVSGIGGTFEDNQFRDIKEYQYHCFNVLFAQVMLTIQERLYKDIFDIKEEKDIMKKYDKKMNYEEGTAALIERNESIRKKIKVIDESFLDVKEQLDKLYDIAELKRIKEKEKKEEEERKKKEKMKEEEKQNKALKKKNEDSFLSDDSIELPDDYLDDDAVDIQNKIHR